MHLSRDGRGRAFDHIVIERLGRRVTYEEVYVKDDQDVQASINGVGGYCAFDNHARLHQSLADRTPAAVYRHGNTMAAATTFN
jgi:putative transposase